MASLLCPQERGFSVTCICDNGLAVVVSLVSPPRFERGTFGSGGRHSIQLSYGDLIVNSCAKYLMATRIAAIGRKPLVLRPILAAAAATDTGILERISRRTA